KNIFFYSDRLNSKKFFYYYANEELVLSDNLFCFSNITKSPSRFSIASYLTNGFLEKESLIENVKISEYATSYHFQDGKLSMKRYWHPKFQDQTKGSSKEELQNILFEKLTQSVERSIANHNNINISLSGGYDVGAILGILRYELGIKHIECHTYYHNTSVKNSDLQVAEKQAGICNYKFSPLSYYSHNILEGFNNNAKWGYGTANFCEEIEFWNSLHLTKANSNELMLFGDEFFGINAPNSIPISNIPFFLDMRDVNNLLQFSKCLTPDFKEYIIENPRTFNKESDQIDYDSLSLLYYDKIISNKITSWRDLFAGRSFEIENPLLNDSVINFMLGINSNYRKKKNLFISAITNKLPHIFQIPRATKSNRIDNWSVLLNSNKNQIREDVNSKSILLDQFIHKEQVISMLKYNSFTNNFHVIQNKALKIIRKNLPFQIESHKFGISKSEFIKRYLIMRKFFELYER
ncbi:MAG: hypothetical protein MI922_02270, partial [Bacteroidales bacterium]|nr:hypothetical protein [Bacteroidales bacterium]